MQNMLKMIEQDGDSFAKRAEMYYKRRPELINSVEEAYRAFRALAERYDKLSKELHTANHTIATVFPEQIQMAMEDDDELGSPRFPKNLQIPLPANEAGSPKLSKAAKKDLKPINTKPFQFKNRVSNGEDSVSTPPAKSALSKQEGIEEIDRLQKEICGLQTVKEFVRSSYESGVLKFQEIEKQIMEMQQRVCRLQDEFGVGGVMEDDKARDLIAETALKSCEESLAELQEKQEKCAKEAKEECQKIEDADRILKSIKSEYLDDDQTGEKDQEDESQTSNQEAGDAKEGLQQKSKEEQIDGNPMGNLTVTELTIKIDELVNKVVTLEITVTSQTAIIDRLKTEGNDLHARIRSLEEDKASLTEDKHNLSIRVKELEEELMRLKNLNQEVENENNSLHTQLAEALSSVDNLSEKLKTVKPDKEVEAMEAKEDMEKKTGEQEVTKTETVEIEKGPNAGANNKKGESTKSEVKHVTFAEPRILESPMQARKNEEENLPLLAESVVKTQAQAEAEMEKDEKFNWQKMLLNGVEDKEKVLLKEYTTILRSYKDVKKQLDEMEKKDRDNQFEVALQISDLKTAIAKRDEEIQNLRKKLNLLPGLTEEEKSAMLNSSTESKMILIDKPANASPVEEKLRMKIDAVLDENLDFWLRFSSSYHQIQKFKTAVKDLQNELIQAKEKKPHRSIKSEIQPAYKHLIETHTELTSWLEQSQQLKDELERRSSAICKIQEEITQALREGVEADEIIFSSHQAAKFHGEVLNMKQEHAKVREELQVGVDHVTALQADMEKALKNLDHEYGFFMDHQEMMNSKTKTRVPLRTFIFGTKLKKQRRSVFSCIQSDKYKVLRDGIDE